MSGHTPRSYDEITRNTVPEPDSSYRPTVEQEKSAYEGERIMSDDERTLHDAVSNALTGSGVDVSHVAVEIDGSRVTLRGHVSDVQVLPRLEDAVRGVRDVGDVVDLIVVDAGAR